MASGEHSARKEVKAARDLLEGGLKAPFDELRRRAAECKGTLDDWDSVRVLGVGTPPWSFEKRPHSE